VGVTGTGVGNITGAGLLCMESIEFNLYTCVKSVLNPFNMSSVTDNQSLPIGLCINDLRSPASSLRVFMTIY
jgi:hypothetical protein